MYLLTIFVLCSHKGREVTSRKGVINPWTLKPLVSLVKKLSKNYLFIIFCDVVPPIFLTPSIHLTTMLPGVCLLLVLQRYSWNYFEILKNELFLWAKVYPIQVIAPPIGDDLTAYLETSL